MQSTLAPVQFAAPRRSDVAPMALERVLRTLRLLADEPDGLTLSQLMAQIQAPKTSVHSLLQGLAAADTCSDTIHCTGSARNPLCLAQRSLRPAR